MATRNGPSAGPDRRPRGRTALLIAAGATAATVLLGACGSGGGDGRPDVLTREPVVPAVAEETGTAPLGTVADFAADIRSLAIDPDGGALLVQSPGLLTVWPGADSAGPDTALEWELPTDAGPLAVGDGYAVVPAPDEVLRIDLGTGEVRRAGLDGDGLAAAVLHDGRILVGTEQGALVVYDADLTEQDRITGFYSVNGIVAGDGEFVGVLDAPQTSLSEVDLDQGRRGATVRLGVGATAVTTDGFGGVIAADTAGDQIIVLGLDPLVVRQMAPVGSSPVAPTYDRDRGVYWLALTGQDEVVGVSIATGEPVIAHTVAAVHAPQSIAVGPGGELFIGSADGAGLQTVPAEEIR